MSHIYFYELLLPGGGTRFGIDAIPAEKPSSARMWLERTYENTLVVRLHRLPAWLADVGRGVLRMLKGSVRKADLAVLLRDLAIMSASGIPLLECLRSTIEDDCGETSRPVLAVCRRLVDDIESGSTLAQAFERQSDVFPEAVRGVVTIGDESGTLSEMLLEAAGHVERIVAMRADARQALIYPALSLVAVLGAGAFWIVYVLPSLLQMFKEMNAKLPPVTIEVLAIAQWLASNGAVLLLACSAALVAAVAAWRAFLPVRRFGYRVLHRLPVARSLLVASGVAHLSEYLGILLRAGLDVVHSMCILERTLTDIYYLDRVSAIRAMIERGNRISASMRQVGGFPSLLVRVIAVGEDSGTLDRQLSHVAAEYGARLRRLVATLSEVIKPMLIVVVGGIFLLLVIAVLLPVYSLVGQAMATAH